MTSLFTNPCAAIFKLYNIKCIISIRHTHIIIYFKICYESYVKIKENTRQHICNKCNIILHLLIMKMPVLMSDYETFIVQYNDMEGVFD